MNRGIVIVGGGQAGIQTADSLREAGYRGPVTVLAEEHAAPYQRPPLSKDYLMPGRDPQPVPLRGPGFFEGHEIDWRGGVRAESVDRAARTVRLSSGETLGYEALVLATGARNRELSCPGAELPGVHGLRTLEDAQALHKALPGVRDVVVVGAGFIGLEFAAAARAHGARVTVLEFADRPMGRAVSPVLGHWFTDAHRAHGIEVRCGEGIASIEAGPDGRVAAAVSTTGARYAADLVVVGIGVVPNVDLAAACGLRTDNGVVVDARLRTEDPHVYAVGDCANFPHAPAGPRLRLESVHNASDQARHVARTLLGSAEAYLIVPWFWSVQGPFKLQMVGLSTPQDETVLLGDRDAGKFSVLCFRDGVLSAVESVNRPADHMAARALLTSGAVLTREQATAEGFTLKAAATAARATTAAARAA